ncbi:acriflavin resistance protein [Neiella marina]|uniref:Acriflavin resistance protein n=1 Tax=Neiella marina TaxID=508461 RepID=A0A8J2U9K3_9GAMM|nr:efflux RND transporter periplasmic adaptor subunit [Neiella marina]GGA88873.1 acriflavin resistance protein [Neiella marina]
MFTRKLNRIVNVAALLLLSAGCADSSDSNQAAPPPTVTVAAVEVSELTPSSEFTGRVEAIDSVELRARIEGFLKQQFFNEGESVNQGDVLFEIEKDNYIADVENALGAIERLQGAKKLAEIERDRRAKLVKTHSIAQEQLDIAVAKVEEVNGDLLSAKAALKRAELALSYTDVVAPIGGKIGIFPYSTGDFVGPASEPLALLVSQDPMYVTFPVSQKALLDFQQENRQKGNPADAVTMKVRLANGDLYDQSGTLNFIDVEANPGTDTILVRAQFPNPDGVLVHQQLVEVFVEEHTVETSLTIPQVAIQIDQVGAYVLLVDDANKVQVQRVETGPIINGKVVITGGLKEHQQVITVGIQKVRPGVVVNTVAASNEV